MELGFQTLLTCPHTTAFLSCSDYCQLEIALSGYFSSHEDTEHNDKYHKSQLNAQMINGACRVAFRFTFIANVNPNSHHLLASILKPMIGENYKHLWFYLNCIHHLNTNYEHNSISQRITVFEIYVLLSFHFLHINAEYVVYLLRINQYSSKLQDIIYILNQLLLKLTKIRSHYEPTSNASTDVAASNTSARINVIYREYSIAHLLSILGDYETASISIQKISEKCKQHCLDHKDDNTRLMDSAMPLSLYFKQLYIYLLYNGCETYVESLYSNTYVSGNESENAMLFSAMELAERGIVQQTQWMHGNHVALTHNMNESLKRLIHEYITCQQQYLCCKLRVTKSRASGLTAQTDGLNMLSQKFKEKLQRSYVDIFRETEHLLQNTISDLNALYRQLSNLLEYINTRMLLKNKYSNEDWDEWMRAHNFNSIKCVMKSNEDDMITQTVDKIKQFMDGSEANEAKEGKEKVLKEDSVEQNSNEMDHEILYEIRFKIQTLVSSVSILLIECTAVLGELWYCAASVSCRTMDSSILNKTALELTDASILKTVDAIEMFMDHYYSAHPFNDISLFLLIRMLKDLGKACGFKRYVVFSSLNLTTFQSMNENSDRVHRLIEQTAIPRAQATQYLQFAAIICENLIGKNHSVSKNITRLASHHR